MSRAAPGLDAARSVDPAPYGAPGAPPRFALKPASREEVAGALRAASAEGLTVMPFGGRPDAPPATSLPPFDLALDLSALDRVIEYEPEDLTITAECGATLATLRGALAARGQELPLESPSGAGATLGGTLAANASGARRLRFGAPRDRILGARFALGDGSLARSGGKVVKNVAGYALHRLLCGSRGALAVIVEASLKLLPAPAARAALIYPLDARQIGDAGRWKDLPRLEPAVLTVLGGEAARLPAGAVVPFALVLGFEDDAPRVEQQTARSRALLGSPVAELRGEAVDELWGTLADRERDLGPRVSFTSAHNTPAALAPALEQAGAAGFVFHAPAGRLHLSATRDSAQAAVERLAAHGFTPIGAHEVGAIEPVIPPQQAVLALRSRIRAELDPGHRFAPGEGWERGAL